MTLLSASSGAVKASASLTPRWWMLAPCQEEVKRRKRCLLNYWKREGHFKNKRVPLDKCHRDLLPLRGCLSASLPTMHLGCTQEARTYTQTQRLLQMKAASVMVAVLTRLVVQGKAQIKTVDSSEEQRQNRGPVMLPGLHNAPKPSLGASPVNKGRYVMYANSSPQLKENTSINRPLSFLHRSCFHGQTAACWAQQTQFVKWKTLKR